MKMDRQGEGGGRECANNVDVLAPLRKCIRLVVIFAMCGESKGLLRPLS
jgi:hypothetical protein